MNDYDNLWIHKLHSSFFFFLLQLDFFVCLSNVVRLTDRPDMTLDVYRGRKTTMQQNTVDLQWLEHRWRVYYHWFELVLESLGTNSIAVDLGILGWCFILKMVFCVYSLESAPHWGDSYENTQHTFMSKKIDNISSLCLLTWRYD